MPSMCCVVYCQSGYYLYRSNPEKVSCLLFPKYEELKAKWIRAIPRSNLKVDPKTVICEKQRRSNYQDLGVGYWCYKHCGMYK